MGRVPAGLLLKPHANDGLTAAELGRKYPIAVVDYDPAWPARFEEEEARARAALGALAGRFEHVGSTAVPGLAAKPTIDVLVEVPSFEVGERDAVPRLEDAGYVCMWTRAASDGHLVAVRGYGDEGFLPGVQVVHLHLAPREHAIWERTLFRDRLRAHPDEAEAYAVLKRELAERHRFDREAYTEAKTAFVRRVTEQERAERGERG